MTSYQLDIGIIDEGIEHLANEQKRRKKKSAADEDGGVPTPRDQELQGRPEADHALNFHLKSRDQGCNNGSGIFVLPPDEVEVEITVLPDETDEQKPGSAASAASRKGKRDTGERTIKQPSSSKKKIEQNARFDSVSGLLSKMEQYRNEEEEIEKQLKEAHRDNGMTSLTMQERQDLEDRLERCRVKQAEQVVASVTDYKPRFKANQSSSSALSKKGSTPADLLGLNLTPIEEILNGAMTDPVPIGAKHLKARLAQKAANKLNSQPPRHAEIKKGNKGSAKTGKAKAPSSRISLVASTTDVKATNNQVLKDGNHFLTLNELEIRKPGGRKKVDRSLSAMIKSNTRPLNSLEMGRRNRIDR